jgi:hypothetical protein
MRLELVRPLASRSARRRCSDCSRSPLLAAGSSGPHSRTRSTRRRPSDDGCSPSLASGSFGHALPPALYLQPSVLTRVAHLRNPRCCSTCPRRRILCLALGTFEAPGCTPLLMLRISASAPLSDRRCRHSDRILNRSLRHPAPGGPRVGTITGDAAAWLSPQLLVAHDFRRHASRAHTVIHLPIGRRVSGARPQVPAAPLSPS